MPTIGLRSEQGSNHDLIQCPPVAALTTVMPDGHPQTSVVWCDFDGVCVRVNTMRGFAKERNMRRNPRVTLLCYDPRQPMRYLEVRGTVVELTEAGAAEHLNHLAARRLLDHPEDTPFVVDDCECPRPEHRLTLPG